MPGIGGGYAITALDKDQRARILKANAELKEYELAELQGRLLHIEDVESQVANMAMTCRARLLSIAARLAPKLVGEESEEIIYSKIDAEIKHALLSISTEGLDYGGRSDTS